MWSIRFGAAFCSLKITPPQRTVPSINTLIISPASINTICWYGGPPCLGPPIPSLAISLPHLQNPFSHHISLTIYSLSLLNYSVSTSPCIFSHHISIWVTSSLQHLVTTSPHPLCYHISNNLATTSLTVVATYSMQLHLVVTTSLRYHKMW